VPPSSASRGQWADLDRRVWQLAFARAVNTMGLSLVMTFLAIYVVDTRGYPAWSYGVIALLANVGQSLSSAWAGNLSDRIGRRPLITRALFVRSGFIGLLGLQILLGAPLWTLGVNMMATSALRGCFEPVAYALVADVVRDDQRISAFGLQRMGTNLGWTIGPALGGVLTIVIPYGYVFFLAAAGMVIAGVVTMRIEDPIAHQDRPAVDGELRAALRDAIREPTMRLLLAGTFLAALLSTQMFSTFAIFLTDEIGLTKANVGLLYTLNGAGVLLLQVPALRLIHRFGIARTLPWSSLLEAIAFGMIGAASGFTGAAIAMLAITGAEVVFNPAHQTAIAEAADPARRGRAYGVVGFVQMVGIAMAPLLGGLLFDAIGHHHLAMWATIATIGLAQTLCFSAFVRRRAPAIAAAAPPLRV
jgi:MFS family permease